MEEQGVGQQRRGERGERGDADALPRHAIERVASEEPSGWTKRHKQRLLDMGAGACYLAQPAIATVVAHALQ